MAKQSGGMPKIDEDFMKELISQGVHLCLLKENVTENHLTMNGYIEC